ncbi:CHASE domain-containing protein [Maritalea sp.]|uniref:CHASE domain-containing protein n=1 Tax=Maritalea sp. TaxID=2003361 RepID=UPI003EF8FA28
MKKILPVLVFALVASIGLSMTGVVFNAERETQQKRFEIAANQAVEKVSQRLNQHVALLLSTRSLLKANQGLLNGAAFRRFVAGLDIQNKHAGVQGIGYAQFMRVGDEPLAEVKLKYIYDIERKVFPQTDQEMRSVIILLEPFNERNKAALGFDMYHELTRRAAVDRALQTGKMAATAPVELVQEITEQKQAGFVLYLPFGSADISKDTETDVEGFVFAPFRAGDLHLSAMDSEKQQTVTFRTSDNGEELFQAVNFAPDSANLHVSKELEIGGRKWQIELHETASFYNEFPHFSSLVLGAISGVLAFALAIAAVAQQNAITQAHEVKRLVEASLKQKEMLLQEMQHRIKNSIARILAIARQTGSNSRDLSEFQESFSARLQAMAASQDALTRSKWGRADLEKLLSSELRQVFGEESEHYELKGQPVELNEKATQAIGLVFHELATNALKYGGVTEPGSRLDVSWQIHGRRKNRILRLFWEETSPGPQKPVTKKGFGSKLIDANIKSELGGEVLRTFTDSGLHAEIVIPLHRSV